MRVIVTLLLVVAATVAWGNELRDPGELTRNAAVIKGRIDVALTKTERRRKLTYLWKRYHAHSYSPQLVDRWCREHERYGIADLWYASFCNMSYASCLRPDMSCRGGGLWARGLCDCTQLNAPWSAFADLPGPRSLFNPHVSIRNHCIELSQKVRCGYDYWAALRAVFLPGAPNGSRAWAEQARWNRFDRQYQPALAMYFRERVKGYNRVDGRVLCQRTTTDVKGVAIAGSESRPSARPRPAVSVPSAASVAASGSSHPL